MSALTTAPKALIDLPPVTAWLSDMDGVLVKENRALPGANEFLAALRDNGMPFLVLTNNSVFTNRDLSARLANSGLEIPEENIWTSANATAAFLQQQSPGSTAYVIGEAGLTTAIHTAGYVMTETDPEYVVLGEVRSYDFRALTQAIRFIEGGAKFIATNPDVSGPSDEGTLPACGAIAAMITAATGQKPYFVGTPRAPRWSATAWTRTCAPAWRRDCAPTWSCRARRRARTFATIRSVPSVSTRASASSLSWSRRPADTQRHEKEYP